MTEREHLSEFVAAYLNEVDEHLQTATTQLFAIEAALRKGEAHLRGVREAFRALHTIKGLSAMVGVEAVVTIAHRMEALLRSADRAATRLPPAAVDVLLRGVRAIEQRVQAFGEGREPLAPPLDLLSALDTLDAEQDARLPVRPSQTLLDDALLGKLAPFEREQLEEGLQKGRRVVRAHFVPSKEKAARGLNINSVRESVARLADIVKVLPVSLPVSEEAPGGLSFTLIALCDGDLAALTAATGGTPESVEVLVEAGAAAGGQAPKQEPLAEEDEPAAPGEIRERGFVRVDVARLDDAVDRLSALIVTRFRLSREVAALTRAGVNTRELGQILHENTRQLRDLRAAILRVRMVPLSDLLDRMPLLVRGLRRATQRLVRLELDAGGAELDKAVAERVFPALVHLVRNAVDHAIETPDERVRRGKPEEGLLRIQCSSHSNTRLVISVTDDGRGIDRREVAIKAGAPVPETDAALLELLCRPGLTTREEATTTSGRGMGMEIVKKIVVEQLGGELSLATEVGAGTTFSLRVPLTISIVDAFSFECGRERFVVPVAAVEEILEVSSESLVEGPKPARRGALVSLLRRRGEVLPLLPLSRLFDLPDADERGKKALVVRRGNQAIAFGVDRMLGQQEVVVRPLEDALVRAPGIAGATDLGDGRPTLVLDLVALGASIAGAAPELNA